LKEETRMKIDKGVPIKIKKPPDKTKLAHKNIGRRKKIKKTKEVLMKRNQYIKKLKPMIEQQRWESNEEEIFKNDVHKLIPPILSLPIFTVEACNPFNKNPNSRIKSEAEYAVGPAQRAPSMGVTFFAH
jgi:hypothetical protein